MTDRIEYHREYRKKNKEKRNEYLKEWAKKNPEKRRAQKYRHRYGIDISDYNRILEEQKHSCKICGSDSPVRGKYFMVDHCHKTNKVRGLLCDNCNKGLGHFKDNITLMQNAIEYINADVAELADALDLGSSLRVRVRVSPSVPQMDR